MGAPSDEKGPNIKEGPQPNVKIAKQFAVSMFAVTFSDWDACVEVGGCPQDGGANDAGWGRKSSACHLCELGRRKDICGLALQNDRQTVPPTLARPRPARQHLGIPVIDAMQTRNACREFFAPW